MTRSHVQGEREGGGWRRIASGALGVGLVILLTLGAAARWIPADRYWFLQVLAVGAPYLAGISLIYAAVLFATGARWIAVLLGLVTLAAVIALRPAAEPEGALADADAPGLVVMSFNAGTVPGAKSKDPLAEVLAAERPHVVATQELPVRLNRATGVAVGPPLVEPLVRERAYTIAWPESDRSPWLNTPIFSRLEALGPAEAIFGSAKRGLWYSGGVMRQRYRWGSDAIAVYNVHLRSFGAARPWREGRRVFSPSAWREAMVTYRSDFAMRAEQVRQLRAVLDREVLPFIVCGDLNSSPQNWVYTHLRRGLQDAFAVGGRGWGATFPAALPLVRIDFVFASPEWEVRRAVVNTSLSSDHRPVLAELALHTASP